ncbi:unnamed protein product [Moneuplotes crassus]|uniref:Uncharacterized protein n=1 Tax=Euplotes crassus TaxID=5936 RepID=A0AAD1U4M1_EUPCR|nr:unnamed protein product [Moneuplotes crassus]
MSKKSLKNGGTHPPAKSNEPQGVFKLNKGIILTCRKIYDNSAEEEKLMNIENYMHFATLIHKINLFLLEYKNISAVKNILDIVYSEELLTRIVDFVTNTEYFCNFGLRLLEHFCILPKAREYLENSEVIYVIFGLLRTNDNETIVSAISFLSILLNPSNVSKILSKARILPILIKLLKTKEIEYFCGDILDTILAAKDAKLHRRTLLKEGVIEILQSIEEYEDFIMLPRIVKKCNRIRRELEILKQVIESKE